MELMVKHQPTRQSNEILEAATQARVGFLRIYQSQSFLGKDCHDLTVEREPIVKDYRQRAARYV